MAYPKHAEEAAAKRGTVTTKEFTGALKEGGSMAAEELLMSVIPFARIPKLVKFIKGLTKAGKKAPTKGAFKSMLEERGFKKLASVDPSLNELKVFLKKRSTRSDEIIKISPKRKVPRGPSAVEDATRKAAESKVKFSRGKTPRYTRSDKWPSGSGSGAPEGAAKGSRDIWQPFSKPKAKK